MKVEELGHEPGAAFHDEKSAILGAVLIEVDETLSDEEPDARGRLVDVLPGARLACFGFCK